MPGSESSVQPSVLKQAELAPVATPSQLKAYRDALALDYPELDASMLDFIMHIYKETNKPKDDTKEPSGCSQDGAQPPPADQPERADEERPAEEQLPQA